MKAGSARAEHVPIGAAVPSLARWGLSCDADLVFRTLTTMGARDSRALAAELGMTRRRVDDAVAELRAVGAVRPSDSAVPIRAGAPIWASYPADEVVAALRRRRLRPADRGAQVRHHHSVVARIAGAAELGDGVCHLPTRALTRRRLAELLDAEQCEHLAINTEQAFDAASARAAAPLGRRMVEREIRVRVLGLPPADHDLHVDGALFDQPFYDYREAPAMPMKLLVVDRRVALFPADPADLDRGYLEISQPGVVRAMVLLFERHWADATDPREHGMPDIVLTDRERELVVLLAQGHTDASAAARLRISARSVTSILRTLMDRVGVDNRFQLGLALGATRRVPLPRPSGEDG